MVNVHLGVMFRRKGC